MRLVLATELVCERGVDGWSLGAQSAICWPHHQHRAFCLMLDGATQGENGHLLSPVGEADGRIWSYWPRYRRLQLAAEGAYAQGRGIVHLDEGELSRLRAWLAQQARQWRLDQARGVHDLRHSLYGARAKNDQPHPASAVGLPHVPCPDRQLPLPGH